MPIAMRGQLHAAAPDPIGAVLPISIVLRRENGVEIDASKVDLEQEDLVRFASLIPMMSWVDPYGKTIYNERQRWKILEELELHSSVCASEPVLDEIRRLCELGQKTPHRYLWFLGD